MQGQLFQRCTHFLYSSVLSLGGKVKSFLKIIYEIFWSLETIIWIFNIIKIKCFYPPQILDEHWCIYSYLQILPRENWFYYVRRVYATAINFPCIGTLSSTSELRKNEKRRLLLKTTTHQEKMFHKNHWEFSKQSVKGSLLQEKVKPTFDLGFANTYYPEKYSTPSNIDLNRLNWFMNLQISNHSIRTIPRPKGVKNIL